VIDRIPAQGLKRLVLIGYVSMTGGIVDFLIKNRVETVFMTATGRYRARLGIDEHRHVALRRDQYLRLNDSTFSAAAARGIVNGKLENMQKSVFECTGINEQQYLRLKSRLEDIIDSLDDTVRFYYICSGCRRRVEFIGIGDPPKDVSAWVI